MAGKKPGAKKTGGRVAGTPNKINADIKGMILSALNKAGGEKYLLAQAADNPTAFLTLIGKILPKDVNVGGQADNPIKIIQRTIIDPANNEH